MANVTTNAGEGGPAFYDLALPGAGKALVICATPAEADSVRRSFRLNGLPVDACVFGANLPEIKYGLILVAKKPHWGQHVAWVREVLPRRLAPRGVLNKLYYEDPDGNPTR